MDGIVQLDVPVEMLTAGSFAPYGRVIKPNLPSDGHEVGEMRDYGFSVDGTAALYLIRYPRSEMVATRLERHLTMTEARIALGRPSVILTATALASGLPDLDETKAFLVPGDHGLVFERGVWHGLQAFPVGAESVDFAFISEREAEAELADGQSGTHGRSEIIDLPDRCSTRLVVTDPRGLL